MEDCLMHTEADMKAALDGWFYKMDFELGRVRAIEVSANHIPDHTPSRSFEEYDDDRPPPNAHRWTAQEDETLLTMRRHRHTFREIGEAMGMSKSSIQNRYEVLRTRLGLSNDAPVRQSKYPEEMLERIRQMRETGMGFDEIGPLFGLTRVQANTLHRDYKRRLERLGRLAA
jgi:hypothetical protein